MVPLPRGTSVVRSGIFHHLDMPTLNAEIIESIGKSWKQCPPRPLWECFPGPPRHGKRLRVWVPGSLLARTFRDLGELVTLASLCANFPENVCMQQTCFWGEQPISEPVFRAVG